MSFIVIFVVSSSCIPVHVSRTCSCDSKVSVHLRHLVSLYFPPEVVLHVQHSCSRFEDGGCFHSLQFFHVQFFWSFPCLPVCIFSQKLYLRFSSACFLHVMSEVSFQLLWVDIIVFGIVQGFVNMFPHCGCGFFPSSCRVCFHYFGCYILWVFM